MEKKDLRIIFMGTPEFAVESLKRLVEGVTTWWLWLRSLINRWADTRIRCSLRR